jgi:hypothetical protein
MHVRNIDEINDRLDCFFHTLRFGVSNDGNVMYTTAHPVDGQPQHEVLLHVETPAGLRRTAERTIHWGLNSAAASFQFLKENSHALIEVEARGRLGPNHLNRIPHDCTFPAGEAATLHCRLCDCNCCHNEKVCIM